MHLILLVKNTNKKGGNLGNIKKREIRGRERRRTLHWEDGHTMARRAISWLEFQFMGGDCLAS
jgi:hypothetical protein